MHPRRSSSTSLPESPPPVPVPAAPASPASPANTLWTAQSPTLTLGHSSPELPSLSSLSALGDVPRSRTPSTVTPNDRTDASYYTASWGSPYRHPPPAFNNASAAFDSDDLDEASSALQFGLGHLIPARPELQDDSPNRFNLEHLIPRLEQNGSPNQFTLEHLIQSRLPTIHTPVRRVSPSGLTPRASDLNPTSEEWVRRFLEERWNREENSWRSESNVDVDSDRESVPDEDIRILGIPKRGHKPRNNNKTLNQQDFWRHVSKEQKEVLGKMMASKYAESDITSHPRHPSEPASSILPGGSSRDVLAPVSPTDSTPLPSPRPHDLNPNMLQPPISRSVTPTPRMRKKIMVKGKGCVISIPRDIPRGTHGYPPKPMTAEAVATKLQNLERQGYNVRGFGHWNTSDAEHQEPHNRAIWPAEADVKAERASIGSRYPVYVPKKVEWDNYVNSLVEAKLAALGVSLGGDDEAPPSMSRQPSSQQYPGLPFSPPLPSNSANGHRMRQGSLASVGSFPFGPSPGHMSRQSVASPAAFANARPSMHLHRHSTFASPANFAHHGMSPSGTWSPGNYFGSQDGRGPSPGRSLSRPDLNALASPNSQSPFGPRGSQQFPHSPLQPDDLIVQMQLQQQQMQQQQLQTQLYQQQQQQQQQLLGLRPSSTLAEVPEDEAEEEAPPVMKHATKPAPEIVIPTPRGHHNHNISQTLEREAADAEYHLEEAIDKQFAAGGDFSTEPELVGQRKNANRGANPTWENSRTILHQPQPHNRTHSLTQSQQPVPFAFPSQQPHNPRGDSDGARSNVSENTNPSLEEGEIRNPSQSTAHHIQAPSQVGNPWKDSKFAYNKPESTGHSKHASRSSISKLNVEAKEFKFNPAASFNPESFSPAFKAPAETAPRKEKPSVESLSGFNVTAPVFKPDAAASKPKESDPAIANGSTLPKSEFNFSSPPSFKPEAPAFNPVVSPFTPEKPVPAPTSFTSKIFGDVNISASDIVKPATRSKAVPIIRPDTALEKTPDVETEKEDAEDEEGRPVQADGREKRIRRGRTDADDVPKFALQPVLASQPLVEVPMYRTPKQGAMDGRGALSEDKENLLPNGAKLEHRGRSPARVTPVPDPVKTSPQRAQLDPIDPDQTVFHLSDAPTASTEEAIPFAKKHAHKTSSLSASAKPFEFRPQQGTVGYDFGFHVTKPSTNEEFEKRRISPSRYASRSPATTFRPSDDGSFKTALESGRRGRYMTESESIDFDPSFHDIDAVMKHMNEEGSDFGVERDDNSWDNSSPQRTPHEFDAFDLRPNTLRSDAPSPSPRRLYAQRSQQASASGQDPFDDERAGLAYDSAVHRLNHAGDVPMSDWDDEGLLTEGDDKIHLRSQFFDKRIDEVMGRSLQNRLGPLEQNLLRIQDALASMSQRSGRGRRSMSTTQLDSDADDEDDDVDSHHRNRSPRKDKRLEKMRSLIREALESHQAQTTSAPAYDSLREMIADVLVAHQPQPAARVDSVPAEQIRAIVEEALASNKPSAQEPASAPVNPEDIRAILTETLALHVPQSAESVKSDDIRAIVMEAIATQPVPTLTEQIRPEDIKAILTEAFAAQQIQTPAVEPVQPETLRSIVADALSSHQPQVPIPSIVEPMQPETIRSIVSEALASHKSSALEAPIDIPQPQFDISEIYQMIGSLKASIAQTTSHHLQAEDVRELLDDALKRQSMEVAEKHESEAIMKRDARLAELQEKLDDQTLRLESEIEARQALEARESDTSRLLKVTEEELSLLQKAASDDEGRIRALTEERDGARHSLDTYQSSSEELRHKLAVVESENEEIKLKNIALETSEEDFKKKLDVVTSENEALTFTLEEHRLSANKWRDDIQAAHQENDKLRKINDQARYQAEEAARIRESMRGKFEKLQQDMVLASQQIAVERAQWQRVDEDSMKKYEILSARIEAEGRTRERLEMELERLEIQEREGMKLRIHFEQAQKQNARLEEIINQLRHESLEHQKNAERCERDMREAREAAHVEIRRTRVLLEADIDAANNQVNIVRHNLESEVARTRAELDNVRMDADTAKAKHELDLEAASDATKEAVQEAHASNKRALLEQQLAFERSLEHVREEHARAIEFAQEDRQRAESFHNDKLALADSRLDHFKDKIALLEEKLVVTKEAASAAAAAASKSASTSTISASGPEKISPQALRESISVLQEQLQEREARIETLEQQLDEVDNEAPAKLKERDTEINWLRELLGVRVDDLNDLIGALAQPTFDRENVRDAAIRIRTNLQMEQQEKERLIAGGQQSFPTLATLSNFASPKAVQFAAAFGNWRKGRGENAPSALAGSSSNASASRSQTPSRPASHSAQSFLSGLMTPPTSNLRRTPDVSSSSKLKEVRSNSISSHGSTEAGFPALGKQTAAPRTPPLMRKTSYDRDAEVEQFSDNGFYDDDSTVDGGDVTPIALNFGQELRRESSRH